MFIEKRRNRMKVFISADIEGVNGICSWKETEYGHLRYAEFKKQMTAEVNAACLGAWAAGAGDILIKDAHDSAMNIDINGLPSYVRLHRGWEGSLCSMMAGIEEGFDAVIFIGYHSPSRSDGNSLSHTMNTSINHIKINNEIASEFLINSLYASSLGIPVAFLSGDLHLTKLVLETNKNIEIVATKEGRGGAALSKHPSITNEEIKVGVQRSLSKDLSNNLVPLPKDFHIEIQYRNHIQAYKASHFPGCKLIEPDILYYYAKDYHDVLKMFMFNL